VLQAVPGFGYLPRVSFTFEHIIILLLLAAGGAWGRCGAAGVTLLVGGLGLTRDTFRAAWALPALALYPLSLGAVWWLDTYLGWQ